LSTACCTARRGWPATPAICRTCSSRRKSRGKRIGRALIEAVYTEADRRDIKQVYWLTHHRNAAARHLYDRLGVNAGFVLYERFAEVDGEASTS
jgi:GNAT superfamily N-acetyltransferase